MEMDDIETNSTFNNLLSNINELVLPSKCWGTHVLNGKLAILSVQPSISDNSVKVYKCVLIYENREQDLQVDTSILNIPVKIAYLNYQIKDTSHLQAFINDFERVQFCKYYFSVQNEACETIGNNFSDVCANCVATYAIQINPAPEQTTIKCTHCAEKFSSLEAMKCHVCVFHNKRIAYARRDVRIETQEQSDICKICGFVSSSSKQLADHELAHFDGSFKCSVCHENFNYYERLITHTKKYHPYVPFIKCHQCNHKFTSLGGLRVHERSHADRRKSFACSKCPLKFYSKMQVDLHERYHKPTNYNCKMCPKQFSNRNDIIFHHIMEHPKLFYACTICRRGFEKKIELLKHEQEYHGVKLLQCKYCSKYFKRKYELEDHEDDHRSGNRYICPICHRRYPTLDLAKEHTCDTNNYKCETCNKMFQCARALDIHSRRHTMQNLFECEHCNRFFSTKGNLTSHMHTHEHSDTKPEYSSEVGTAGTADL